MIASFRSRSVTLSVYNQLLRRGVTCALISTPTQANVGCGLSVRFSEGDYYSVKSTIANSSVSYAGIFLVTVIGGRSIVTKL